MRRKYKVENKEELKEIIRSASPDADLNYLDVSGLTDISNVFYKSNFNGNISEWDVSNVTNMMFVFEYSDFNGDISKWDVSNVTNMYGMFSTCSFNGDISEWDVSSVTEMSYMFTYSSFNRDISKWDININSCNIGSNETLFVYESKLIKERNYHYLPQKIKESLAFEKYRNNDPINWYKKEVLGNELSDLL